jgi:uroporphyrin-III C-methyltransferase
VDAVFVFAPAAVSPATERDAKDIAMNTNSGKVTLLSAGPGDLDLLTLRAAKALAAADVVLLDDLVNPEIVTLAREARVIRVGKRGGCRSTPQAFIERLMRRYAQKGLHVVRVKGGEALLFGRAGEELAALREAGIPVEIVNGISSGFAAAAGLGISLTHRRHCQGVTFVTAHKEDHGEPDWAALAATRTTLAIYMGMRRIESLASALLAILPACPHAGRGRAVGRQRQRAALADAPRPPRGGRRQCGLWQSSSDSGGQRDWRKRRACVDGRRATAR